MASMMICSSMMIGSCWRCSCPQTSLIISSQQHTSTHSTTLLLLLFLDKNYTIHITNYKSELLKNYKNFKLKIRRYYFLDQDTGPKWPPKLLLLLLGFLLLSDFQSIKTFPFLNQWHDSRGVHPPTAMTQPPSPFPSLLFLFPHSPFLPPSPSPFPFPSLLFP